MGAGTTTGTDSKKKTSRRKGRTRFSRIKKRWSHRIKREMTEFNRFDALRMKRRRRSGERTTELVFRLGLGRWYKDEILTLNKRNKLFVNKYNPKPAMKEATKTNIKKKLEFEGIPVPATYMVLEDKNDLEKCRDFLEHDCPESFVIKPDNSFGGRGILIIKRRVRDYFISVSDLEWHLDRILAHITRVLEGRYSRGKKDKVLIEQRVISTDYMEDIVDRGLPDIRVISLIGYPVMAMTRIPTKASHWRANLHRGAVGAGIKLSTGKIVHAIYRNRSIKSHPDSGQDLIRFQIPYWRDILEMACRAQVASDMGYVGVDMVIDDKSGPLVMEVNKRAGLDIQVANDDGLLKRLKVIERKHGKKSGDFTPFMDTNPKHRVHQAIIYDQKDWKV